MRRGPTFSATWVNNASIHASLWGAQGCAGKKTGRCVVVDDPVPVLQLIMRPGNLSKGFKPLAKVVRAHDLWPGSLGFEASLAPLRCDTYPYQSKVVVFFFKDLKHRGHNAITVMSKFHQELSRNDKSRRIVMQKTKKMMQHYQEFIPVQA